MPVTLLWCCQRSFVVCSNFIGNTPHCNNYTVFQKTDHAYYANTFTTVAMATSALSQTKAVPNSANLPIVHVPPWSTRVFVPGHTWFDFSQPPAT